VDFSTFESMRKSLANIEILEQIEHSQQGHFHVVASAGQGKTQLIKKLKEKKLSKELYEVNYFENTRLGKVVFIAPLIVKLKITVPTAIKKAENILNYISNQLPKNSIIVMENIDQLANLYESFEKFLEIKFVQLPYLTTTGTIAAM